MMMRLFPWMALAGLGLLAACDPISEDQCRAGDWAGLGLEDGQAGRPASRLDDYAGICSALGIEPNREVYMSARAQGLKTFCTPQNAYAVGREGRSIGAVCPAAQMSVLQAANNSGRRYHDIAAEIDELEARIDDQQERLVALRGVDTEEAAAERSRLRSSIREKERDIFRLELRLQRYAFWP